ncbi:hypothetical protein [Psychromicrobium xiongbiense]|uniref:hypothetical protein n=1 Tax=Psychromicrobium xiongbiense TaxID=3051184 RepID=UPI002552CC84|nr:hypothetical protein [Psychromicrobium sp. YIM S02556]
MRSRVDWLDLGLQFLGFVVIYLVLAALNWPWLLKLAIAFLLAIGVSVVLRRIRLALRKRRSEPKRIRVISVETVDDTSR